MLPASQPSPTTSLDLQMPRHCHYLPWWAWATSWSWARAVISLPLTLSESHQLMQLPPSPPPPCLVVFTWLWADWWDVERERIRKTDKEYNGLKDSHWWRTHGYSQRQPRGERMGCRPVGPRNCTWSTIGTADGTESIEMLGWKRCGGLRQVSLSPLSASHSTSPPLPISPIPPASSLIYDALPSDISLVSTVSLGPISQILLQPSRKEIIHHHLANITIRNIFKSSWESIAELVVKGTNVWNSKDSTIFSCLHRARAIALYASSKATT